MADTSVNKSWVELCDDELNYSDTSDSENRDHKEIFEKNSKTESLPKNKSLGSPKKNEKGLNKNTPSKHVSEKEAIETKVKIKVEKEESPWRFSYATILKNSASKENIEDSLKTPSNQVNITEIVETKDNGIVKSVKREIQREFLQDDLSLSSHLDVFHMQSPIKLEPLDEQMGSPMKSGREMRSSKKRLCTPTKLSLSEDAVLPDDVLMPSPKKVTRLSSRRKREPGESPLVCKRSKHSPGSRHTPKCVVPVESPTIELETDEQVLGRRQKQIDYGKNTIGYERYLQMVPKHKRHRKHPQTPPRHVKYSRRAWDGLIRQWRQQLHFWDPPSQGGGNIDDLDLSSMSEASSDTGSTPATPRDRHRTGRTSRVTRSNRSSECSSLAEDSGCSPLKDN
ncbi:histone RNA hairpin-binding protein isoform X2 [Macrosteles quadrilineatus]|nr:histone RNA hairpin-binding protein isoform X2 [Macrosteles quadrilineatus]